MKSNTNYAEIEIKFDKDNIKNIKLSGFSINRKDVVGITGVVVDGDQRIFALQGAGDQLAHIDSKHTVIGFSNIEGIDDIHGIIKFEEDLICVSTGQNSVINTAKMEKYGRNEFDGLGLDVEHINDICLHQGRIIGSRFGKKRINGMRNGCVFDLLDGAILLDGLSEPHSVVSHCNRLYVLDSRRGAMIELNKMQGPIAVVSIAGYARGLCLSDRFILIGCSKRRTQSRKDGRPQAKTLYTSEHHANSSNMSGVYLYDTKNLQSIFVDTSESTDEIYQIVEIESGPN